MNAANLSQATQSDDKDAPLREDIRLLGRLLGETIRGQEGDATFELVESQAGHSSHHQRRGGGAEK